MDTVNGQAGGAPPSLVDAASAPATTSGKAEAQAPTPDPDTEPIPEKRRNTTLAKLAGKMRRSGFNEGEILAALRQVNAVRCQPPLPDNEVERVAASIGKKPPGARLTSSRPPSQATQLAELARTASLFHAPDGEAYATVPIDGHRETWRLQSRQFAQWLGFQFYRATGAAVGAQPVKDAVNVLEARARSEGPEHRVWIRVAEQDGALYLDLANERWEAVEITAGGWRAGAEPPVKFHRPSGMRPLPPPVSGGQLEALRQFVNLSDDDGDWRLLATWLVTTLRPGKPFPLLALHGEQGSAKTTTARMIRAIVDPNTVPVRSEPKDSRDLAIMAENGWLVAFDNLSHIDPALSDNLCRLATGGGFATRKLYTDREEALFDAMRPVLLTGISELATRSDLLDRAILLYLPEIKTRRRRPEDDLWREFETERPKILGALLDTAVLALRNLPTTRLEEAPRMADFAAWGAAAAGEDAERFLEAYERNRESVSALAVETSPVAMATVVFMSKWPAEKEWVGTATELLNALAAQVNTDNWDRNAWPKSAQGLSAALRRLTPNLRRVGVEVRFSRIPKVGTRRVHLQRGPGWAGGDAGVTKGDAGVTSHLARIVTP